MVAQRPFILHPSALSPQEYEYYTPYLAQLTSDTDFALSQPVIRAPDSQTASSVLEWMKTSWGLVVERSTELEIMSFFKNSTIMSPPDYVATSLLRLLSHSSTSRHLAKDHLFIQTDPFELPPLTPLNNIHSSTSSQVQQTGEDLVAKELRNPFRKSLPSDSTISSYSALNFGASPSPPLSRFPPPPTPSKGGLLSDLHSSDPVEKGVLPGSSTNPFHTSPKMLLSSTFPPTSPRTNLQSPRPIPPRPPSTSSASARLESNPNAGVRTTSLPPPTLPPRQTSLLLVTDTAAPARIKIPQSPAAFNPPPPLPPSRTSSLSTPKIPASPRLSVIGSSSSSKSAQTIDSPSAPPVMTVPTMPKLRSKLSSGGGLGSHIGLDKTLLPTRDAVSSISSLVPISPKRDRKLRESSSETLPIASGSGTSSFMSRSESSGSLSGYSPHQGLSAIVDEQDSRLDMARRSPEEKRKIFLSDSGRPEALMSKPPPPTNARPPRRESFSPSSHVISSQEGALNRSKTLGSKPSSTLTTPSATNLMRPPPPPPKRLKALELHSPTTSANENPFLGPLTLSTPSSSTSPTIPPFRFSSHARGSSISTTLSATSSSARSLISSGINNLHLQELGTESEEWLARTRERVNAGMKLPSALVERGERDRLFDRTQHGEEEERGGEEEFGDDLDGDGVQQGDEKRALEDESEIIGRRREGERVQSRSEGGWVGLS